VQATSQSTVAAIPEIVAPPSLETTPGMATPLLGDIQPQEQTTDPIISEVVSSQPINHVVLISYSVQACSGVFQDPSI
jgi:hypothetical protein